jgi:hypothetical protein
MNRFRKTAFVNSGGDPLLRRILEKWIEVQHRYTTALNNKDFAWYYGERTCIGFLAAAAWECGCVVLEEWQTEKRVRALSKAKKPKLRRGRSDLYIHHPSGELNFEAKYFVCRATGKTNKMVRSIEKKFSNAVRDCAFLEPSAKEQISLLFLVPFYPAKKRDSMSEHLSEWLKCVCAEVPHSAVAWLFIDRREHAPKDDAFPGIVLLARRGKFTSRAKRR